MPLAMMSWFDEELGAAGVVRVVRYAERYVAMAVRVDARHVTPFSVRAPSAFGATRRVPQASTTCSVLHQFLCFPRTFS